MMRVTFPSTRSFSGFNAPGRVECDVLGLEVVEGAIPGDLDGTFFRVGPDPQWPPLHGDDIPLNGDGMACAFRFKDGRVDFKSRYIETQKFMAERAAGRALFGVYRNPYTDDASVQGLSRGTANTNLVWHAGKLLALKEDSRPVVLDPHTLATLDDSYDFGGQLNSPTFTAHPKIDPVTGDMFGFGYEAKGEATPDIAFYVIGADGKVSSESWFAAPYPSMVHDFGVTREHVVFAISPLVADLELLKKGGPHFTWDSSKDVYVGVFPRPDIGNNGVRDIRWFRAPTCFSSHVMNAYTDRGPGGEILVHFDTPAGDMVVFPFFPSKNGERFDQTRAVPYMERWTFDLSNPGDAFQRRKLAPFEAEFPRVDDRYLMGKHRHAWASSIHDGATKGITGGSVSGKNFNALAHFDLATGVTTQYYAGDGCGIQEPTFIPRPGSSEEGDGYVVALVNHLAEARNDLILLDARDFKKGPVARVRLPLRLRNGLHGNWVAAADLEG
jgi:carotenoid cleavage dioxygenase